MSLLFVGWAFFFRLVRAVVFLFRLRPSPRRTFSIKFCVHSDRCFETMSLGVSQKSCFLPIRQNLTTYKHCFATYSFRSAPKNWFNPGQQNRQNIAYAMLPLNKVWARIDWAYVSTPITANCLMQIVPHNGIHYFQMRAGNDVALF